MPYVELALKLRNPPAPPKDPQIRVSKDPEIQLPKDPEIQQCLSSNPRGGIRLHMVFSTGQPRLESGKINQAPR